MYKVTKKLISHVEKGNFKYQNKKPCLMLSGGHGIKNLEYLKKNKLNYKIDDIFENGTLSEHIIKHIRKKERKKHGHVWFPKNWTILTIINAGKHVASLKRNINKKDHTAMYGKYKKVDVVSYKKGDRICGICPNYKQNGKEF